MENNIYILEQIVKRSMIFCIPAHAKVLCAVVCVRGSANSQIKTSFSETPDPVQAL